MTAPQRVFRHYISDRSLLLGLSNAIILAASMWTAVLSSIVLFDSQPQTSALLPHILTLTLVGMVALYVVDLYGYHLHAERKQVAVRGTHMGLVWGILAAALEFSVPGFPRVGFRALVIGT